MAVEVPCENFSKGERERVEWCVLARNRAVWWITSSWIKAGFDVGVGSGTGGMVVRCWYRRWRLIIFVTEAGKCA